MPFSLDLRGRITMIKNQVRKDTTLLWFVAFFILSLAVTQDGGTNAMSRFAALRAIVEQHQFSIDSYLHWTVDWSLAPNGYYYSNKAPGSFLLVTPIFWVIDTVSWIWEYGRYEPTGIRNAPGYFHKTLLSFLGQILPLIFLFRAFTEFFRTGQYSEKSLHWMLVAALFGSTASLFMNNWFGHGFAAILYLATILAFLRGASYWFGLGWGALVLSDYAAVLFLPAFIVALFYTKSLSRKFLQNFLLGVLPGALLWVWYHTVAFGSPLYIATMFLNPTMRDLEESASALFGVIQVYPKLGVLQELLWGAKRGVLVTQPWVLVLMIAAGYLPFVRLFSRMEKGLISLVLTNFIIALLFNASVGAWHAGFTAGPRYMTPALFGMVLLIPIFWNRLHHIGKWILSGAIVYAVIFRAAVYATTILIPPFPMWPWIENEFKKSVSGTPYLRFAIFCIVLLGTLGLVLFHKHKKRESY